MKKSQEKMRGKRLQIVSTSQPTQIMLHIIQLCTTQLCAN